MTKRIGQSEKWILPTSMTLSGVTALYFFVLFPKDATDTFLQNLNYIILGLIVILALTLTGLLYRRQLDKKLLSEAGILEKKLKTIEQVIWRNRYVLQSQKAKLMCNDTNENRQQWQKVKAIFAIESIFPKIPEEEVPFHIVSKLIEKSLSGGGSLGSIKLPTYNVINGNEEEIQPHQSKQIKH